MSMVRNMSIYVSERAVFGGKSVRHRERKRQKGDVDETRKTGGEIGREFLEASSARGWLIHKVKVFMGYKSCTS